MKTRSEWGSWEDFKRVMPGAHHVERILPRDMNYCELTLAYSSFDATAETPEEARRLVVEKYSETVNGPPLPWRPDYDLSTEEGCKEAIKSCGYKINIPNLAEGTIAIQIVGTSFIRNIWHKPTLEQWQEAAKMATALPTQ